MSTSALATRLENLARSQWTWECGIAAESHRNIFARCVVELDRKDLPVFLKQFLNAFRIGVLTALAAKITFLRYEFISEAHFFSEVVDARRLTVSTQRA
jgi:hypothetical protein